LGRAAAAAILARRANDGAAHPEPRIGIDYITSDAPGKWRQDQISQNPLALGAHWGDVTPFVLRSGDQFRVPPPPDLDNREYTGAYNEVKAVGGDGIVTPTVRTADQTLTGIFWAYDGTPTLCAPPRLYNQIVLHIAEQRRTGGIELARLLALVNVAIADAGVAIWESKYHYVFWRPVTGIRESDGNLRTPPDPTYSPLGAPASNLNGPNFTPPFPAYPSGHAGFGGALFQILRDFYGTDRIAFTFVSDELNGETLDNEGNARPLGRRPFLKTPVAGAAVAGVPLPLRAQPKPFKIGAIHPVTGPLAEPGQACRLGAQLAVEAVNAAGGVKGKGGLQLELITGDTQSKPENGRVEAERVVNQGAQMLVGSFDSGSTAAMVSVAQQKRLPFLIDIAAADPITANVAKAVKEGQQKVQYVYRNFPTGSGFGRSAVRYFTE